jgi:hypothetical protein
MAMSLSLSLDERDDYIHTTTYLAPPAIKLKTCLILPIIFA